MNGCPECGCFDYYLETPGETDTEDIWVCSKCGIPFKLVVNQDGTTDRAPV